MAVVFVVAQLGIERGLRTVSNEAQRLEPDDGTFISLVFLGEIPLPPFLSHILKHDL